VTDKQSASPFVNSMDFVSLVKADIIDPHVALVVVAFQVDGPAAAEGQIDQEVDGPGRR
jgi:hypothetical protein